jgi:hypothetical protein
MALTRLCVSLFSEVINCGHNYTLNLWTVEKHSRFSHNCSCVVIADISKTVTCGFQYIKSYVLSRLLHFSNLLPSYCVSFLTLLYNLVYVDSSS